METQEPRSCQKCGHELRKGARRDAKLCGPCRILRDMQYARKKLQGRNAQKVRTRKCDECDAEFRPHHIGSWHCAEHFTRARPDVACKLCKEDRPSIETSVPLCLYCSTGVETQERAYKALQKGQRDRKEQAGGTRTT